MKNEIIKEETGITIKRGPFYYDLWIYADCQAPPKNWDDVLSANSSDYVEIKKVVIDNGDGDHTEISMDVLVEFEIEEIKESLFDALCINFSERFELERQRCESWREDMADAKRRGE